MRGGFGWASFAAVVPSRSRRRSSARADRPRSVATIRAIVVVWMLVPWAMNMMLLTSGDQGAGAVVAAAGGANAAKPAGFFPSAVCADFSSFSNRCCIAVPPRSG